ncbi:MAG: DUF3592 domain-containing protein [Anaerolineae bacterium]|nr:DUF3592 domain-containing protein [Anaerolineae bacterium]
MRERRDEADALIAAYEVGQSVPIYYDPEEVTNSVLEPGATWLVVFPCGFGLFLVAALVWIAILLLSTFMQDGAAT